MKKSISIDQVTSSTSTDSVSILCKWVQVTGYDWTVVDNLGNEDIINYTEFNIIGKNPYDVINKSIRSKFLFTGYFKNDVFVVNSWELVGDIERVDEIIPYPKKYLNIFDLTSKNIRK